MFPDCKTINTLTTKCLAMLLKSLPKILICFSVLLITANILGAYVSVRKVMAEPLPLYNFLEQALVMVNCSEATLTAAISLMTSNETFVHYPSGVNMMDTHFELCESVTVSVAPTGCVLAYIFNTTNTAVAQGHANAITPSINGAFDLSFSFFSVGLTNGRTNITYTASAITNVLSYYTSTLKPSCLKSDLAGFSNAIPNLLTVLPSKSYAGISAYKTSEGYDWQYIFFACYFGAQIPTGTGYTIDVLNRLGAASLTPSSHTYTGACYMSIVPVMIEPKTTVNFVSCSPDQVNLQYISRGWYVFPSGSTDTLNAIFYFGNDANPATVLNLRFSGTIVPEFSSLTLIITIMVCTMGVVAFKKRFSKTS